MMRTPWMPAEPVPLPEYPRPQLTRPGWTNLNGWWEYKITPKESRAPQMYDGSIRVPFPVESLLSGVQRLLLPEQKLWYRRTFQYLRPENGGRVLLHFGAVDYECQAWINGQSVGGHRGGYLPFTFDITTALADGVNELVVSAWDPTDTGRQQRGKQVLRPNDIWYTAVSGIWQTVWLESVSATSIESLKISPDLDAGLVSIEVQLRGAAEAERLSLEAEVYSKDEIVISEGGSVRASLKVAISHPKTWSLATPHLYDLRLRLTREGRALDEVGSYFAMRKFGLGLDKSGHLRFMLNNEPLFLFGPLDQGYFPDGLYTPPSEEAMLFDIEYARRIGCNMIRKHIKVEPLRWYYACDRLGMIVWQDMPSGGLDKRETGSVPQWIASLFGRDDTHWLSRYGRGDKANRVEFRSELKSMIDHLYNTACVAVWVPFNEGWGQFQAKEITRWVKAYDPTRLVDHASGWFDQGAGDFQSTHVYFRPLERPEPDRRAFALAEFGGYSLKIPGHVWDEEKKFGYRLFETPEALTAAYLALLENELGPLIPQGLAAAVYTQTADVEIEVNGYLTYDRKVDKIDAEMLRKAHLALTGNPLLPPPFSKNENGGGEEV